MAIDDKRVAIDSGRYSTRELSDFQLAV
jgi:hypothetical protein